MRGNVGRVKRDLIINDNRPCIPLTNPSHLTLETLHFMVKVIISNKSSYDFLFGLVYPCCVTIIVCHLGLLQ